MMSQLTLPLLAAVLGFVLARANSCTVAAVDRLVDKGRWDWLMGLATAAAMGAATLVILIALPVDMFSMPRHHALSGAAVIGGLLLGLGAAINGACMLGSVSRLAEGNTSYLLTLVGLGLSLVFRDELYILPEAPSSYAISDYASLQAVPWFSMIFLAVLIWAIWRLKGGHNWRLRYLMALGVVGAILFASNPQWSYLSSIERLIGANLFAFGISTDLAAMLMFLAAATSSWLEGRFNIKWPAVKASVLCLAGGFLMGLGAQVVPGGNDALLLWTIPGAALYGLVAYLIMIGTIWCSLQLSKRLKADSK